jgi:hypothetical protein
MTTNPTTTAELERQVDEHILVASGKTAEIDRIGVAVEQMEAELGTLDARISDASADLAGLDLAARLDGSKAPKSSPELDGLHGQRRRLEGAIAAAHDMQAALDGDRREALAVAGRLAGLIAETEFQQKSAELARAWKNFHNTFAEFSALAQISGHVSGWNSPNAHSPYDGMKNEIIEGVRISYPDYDLQALQAAVGRSNASRVLSKIPDAG